MTAFATLELDYPTPTTVECRVETGEDTYAFEGAFSAPSADLLDAVYTLPSVLGGDSAPLLRFADWRLRLQVRPRDADAVQLAVTDGTDPEVTVPVATDHLCEAFVTAGRTYLKRLRDADITTDCYRLALTVGLHDLERRVEHYDAGRMDDYEPFVERANVETFVFDCRRNDHLVAFVAGTDALTDFVADLRRCDDEYATDAYRQLLQHRDAVCAHALRHLRDAPDDRARQYLRNVCWSNDPELRSLALDALETVDREEALDAALTLAKDRDPDAIVAAARLFADIGAEAVGDAQCDRIESTLDRAADRIDDTAAADEVRTIAEQFRVRSG